jgi:nucleoside-diphosphate kinase
VAIERAFSIIKPDAVSKSLIGEVYRRFEKAGLQIVAAKMVRLTRRQAEAFYAVHKDRSFFNNLIDFMTSGPIMVQVLEGGNAIALNRKLMGATNPSDAELGTIRADYATNVTLNAVHGSDSPDTAKKEIAFFFSEDEICVRTV